MRFFSLLLVLLVTCCSDKHSSSIHAIDNSSEPEDSGSLPDTQPHSQETKVTPQNETSSQKTTPLPTSCPTDAPEFHMVNVGAVTLNVACQGNGQVLLLLHGFPEFWFGWHKVMTELSDEFQLIVPDQRGYNLSDKPEALEAYVIEQLASDIVGLLNTLDSPKVVLVGHDWGGVVAWALAAIHPELFSKLVILNAPHPQVFARELKDNPAQQEASAYITWFMNPQAETLMSANNFSGLAESVFNDAFSEDEIATYKKAWGQPGALTAMLNWYRANFSDGTPPDTEVVLETIPTLVLWGMKDTALLPGNLDGLEQYVTDLTITKFENATHWIAHEDPKGVADEIRKFVLESR